MQRELYFRLCVLGVLMGCLSVSCSPASGTLIAVETPVESIACEGVSIGNPAASYCSLLGYQYDIQDTNEGQTGVCTLPDGSNCEEWQFLRGKCGEDFSWCALNGMEIQTVTESEGASIQEYAVCVDSNGTIVGKVFDLSGLQALLNACN
jgi:uncharacterized protein